MKKQIRKGVFETNSSSTHSLCVAQGDVYTIPKRVRFEAQSFGWSCDKYTSTEAKANYLFTCLQYFDNIDTITKYLNKFRDILKRHGVQDVDFGNFIIQPTTWSKDVELWLGCEDDCYIDHGDQALDFVERLCDDEEMFLSFLFSPKSFILTGNDNDDEDVEVHVDYPHYTYYKGN